MKKINIQDWKEFKIEELFSVNPTKNHKVTNKDLMHEDGINPVVVNSSYNNGIGGYTNYEITESGNVITFSDTTNADSIFYQENDFVGYSHVQVLKPIKYNEEWNKECLIFFTAVFKKKAKLMNFDYVNKFTREDALKMIVKLPIDISGEPDWEYMERYVKQLYARERESSDHVTTYLEKSKSHKIDIKNWKKFNLYDEYLFDIDAGTKLDKVNMTTIFPKVNFVGRSNFNNGITEKVDLIKGIEPYKAGNLTLSLGGAYLGSCFIQKEQFYTSQNVVVLIPKLKISEYCKKFIATMIFKESQTYYKAFENELNRHIKRDFSIYLPVKSDNSPDWEYMENYMKKLETSMKNIIKANNNSINVS